MPRRKLHDEFEEDEVTTVGENDDLGPLDDLSDEDDAEFDRLAGRRLFDDPEDEDDDWDEEFFDDEDDEDLYEEEE
jgi:hypothetical protein